VRRAEGSGHRGGKMETLLGNLQIDWLDLDPDAVSAGGNCCKISGAGSDEGIENRVARERE